MADTANRILKNGFGSFETTLQRILIVFFAYLPSLLHLSAQDLQLDFHHLSQDDGLSQGTNVYVMEDSRGFIWISSVNGLNRFDGKTVKTYLPNPEDPFALAGGNINSNFFEDRHGDIWFTSNVAIQRYVRKKDHFETIRLFDDSDSLIRADIIAFHLDSTQNLWLRVGTDSIGRLHIYNTSTRKDSILYHLDGQRCQVMTDSNGEVSTLVSSMFDETWGFEIINHRNGTRQRFLSKKSEDSIRTYNFYIQDQRNIWFGSRPGLLHFNTETKKYRLFDKFQNESFGRIWQVIPWKDKLIVSSGLRGVLVFDLKSETFTQAFSEQDGIPGALGQNNAYELYIDQHDILWVSLWGKGLNYASLDKVKFKSPMPVELRDPVHSLIEGPNGEIWCTTKKGILAFTRDHKLITTPFTVPGWNEAKHRNWIPMLFKDRMQRIWLSLYTDVFQYDDGAFHFSFSLKDPPKWIITLSNGRTLVSTNVGMFELIDSISNTAVKTPREFERYRQTAFERMYEDASGRLYISKNSHSLLVFQSEHNTLRLTEEINGVGDCNAFLPKPGSDSLWICIETGVILLDPKTMGYRYLLEEPDGLPAETYYSLIPDDSGKIWLSGNKGIVRYDPVKKEHKRYTRADGMQSLEFKTNAYCLSTAEEIWFGGTNGINVFDPLSITHIPHLPQVHITNMLVNDERYVTDTYIGEMTEMKLDYQHNTLSFEFVGIEFSDPKSIAYKYRLIGADDDWVESHKRNFVRYSNLPPGDYQFEIIASNSDGVWNTDNPRILKIAIKPPFTRTASFYILLLFLVGSMIYLLYRFQLKRKLETAEKKRLLEMDELKNRLYTNITHEFRTPLTLIHGPVSLALTRDKALEKKDLRSIFNQSERLQQLINQMLDLQKLDAGKLAIKYEHGDVVQLAHYLLSSFETAAKEKGILLVFSSTPGEINMDYDKEKLTQMVSNLLLNAIKHTPANGKISMILNSTAENKLLAIKVQDTGVGIDPADLPYIFDRFYQSSRAAVGGTGIGLELTKNLVELLGGTIAVESTLNFGTTFTILLPIAANAKKSEPEAKRPTENIVRQDFDDEAFFTPTTDAISNKPIALVVEDHPEVLKFIVTCLSEDFMTLTSTDGDDGIKKAFEHTPDLIISDIMMPGKNGFELCSTLKNDIHTSHIPIILLTGRSDQAALMSGIEQGADAYVVKPFDPDELVLRAKKLLELRTKLSQHYRLEVPSGDEVSVVKASPRENAFLQKTRAIIEEHMNDAQFNMQVLSQHMAMSHSQLQRKISALTGESIVQFVRSVRMKKAIELLKDTDLTVSEVAYEIGFSDPGYFGKVFAKEYNMSPSEYRQVHFSREH